ncbi:hypothetical protein FRC06_009164, partial [Ceratobasidium sp. 370]
HLSTFKKKPPFADDYEVLKEISPAAYHLKLPHTLQIHNVVHVGKLSKYHRDPIRTPKEPESLVEGDIIQEVEAI